MSSILKALKRIEAKSPRSESFFTLPKTIDTKQAINSKTSRRWFVPGLIIVCLVLLVIAAAAIIFFSRRKPIIAKKFPVGVSEKQKENPSSLLEKSNIFRAKIHPRPTSPAESPSPKSPPAKKQIKSTVPAGKGKKIPAKARPAMADMTADQQNSKLSAVVRSPQPEADAALKRTLQERTPAKNAVVPEKSVAARSVPAGKPATRAQKPDRTRTYDRIDESKLKLQALAWFSDAAKRMVVINSQIVREGGSVDGYQVTQIRRQEVIVSDGRKSWRLEFGLKQ